jgi:hypothetical protein
MSWVTVVFMQDEDYYEVRDMDIREMAEYLAQWDFGEENDMVHVYDDPPWESLDRDHDVWVGGIRYVLAMNRRVGYVSLNRIPIAERFA